MWLSWYWSYIDHMLIMCRSLIDHVLTTYHMILRWQSHNVEVTSISIFLITHENIIKRFNFFYRYFSFPYNFLDLVIPIQVLVIIICYVCRSELNCLSFFDIISSLITAYFYIILSSKLISIFAFILGTKIMCKSSKFLKSTV